VGLSYYQQGAVGLGWPDGAPKRRPHVALDAGAAGSAGLGWPVGSPGSTALPGPPVGVPELTGLNHPGGRARSRDGHNAGRASRGVRV